MSTRSLSVAALVAAMLVVPLGVLSQQYDVEQLREDFGVLRLSLEQGHSGLYRYSSKEAIDGM